MTLDPLIPLTLAGFAAIAVVVYLAVMHAVESHQTTKRRKLEATEQEQVREQELRELELEHGDTGYHPGRVPVRFRCVGGPMDGRIFSELVDAHLAFTPKVAWWADTHRPGHRLVYRSSVANTRVLEFAGSTKEQD